jgi:hypothetical protein
MHAIEIFICPECYEQRYHYEKAARKKYCKKCHNKKSSEYRKKQSGSKPYLVPDYSVFNLKKFPNL